MPVHGAHVHAGVPGAVAAPGLQQEGVGAGVGLHAARAAVPGLLHRVLTRQLGAVQRPAVRLPVLTDRTDNTSQSERVNMVRKYPLLAGPVGSLSSNGLRMRVCVHVLVCIALAYYRMN